MVSIDRCEVSTGDSAVMLDEIPNPALRALYAYWDGKRSGRPMPERRDIDALEMKAWLGRLILVDVVDGGADFRYRLHGSVLTDTIGIDLSGHRLSTAARVFRDSAMREYRESVDRRAPHLVLAASYPDKPYVVFDKLVLPLSPIAGAPSILLAAIYPALA